MFKRRRSVREYSAEEVPEEVLRRVLEAARWAPSAHNAQPWRFVLIKDKEVKLRLARRMAQEWEKDLKADGVPPEVRRKLTEGSIKTFASAPAVLVACLTMEGMDEYPDERRRRLEYLMAVQSVAAAIENVLLAASAEGLGSCWFCAPLFCQPAVQEVLGLPSGVEPQALIALGYAKSPSPPPPRKPLRELVRVDGWEGEGCSPF